MATLNIRAIDDEAYKSIKAAAGAHGMTLPEYLVALHRLHRAVAQAAAESMADPETILAREFLDIANLPLVVI